MAHSKKVMFSKEGKIMFDKIAAVWPTIIRSRKADKIMLMLSFLLRTRKIERADEALVIEAARLVVPKSYDPLFDMFRDMEGFKKRFLDTFISEPAYNKIPVRVRRWQPSKSKNKIDRGKQKKVLAFCASPRQRGNTDMLVEEALRGAAAGGAETEKIMLQKIDMRYCIGCRKCKEPGYEKICVIHDDMSAMYQKIIDADALIIGFPIYTGRECAQLSTFLDRWDGYERYMLSSCLQPGRRAMVIGTWGYPGIDTYDHVIENIISILNLHKVETVEALSACGFEGILHGLDRSRRGVIARYPKQLHKAYAAGKALVR